VRDRYRYVTYEAESQRLILCTGLGHLVCRHDSEPNTPVTTCDLTLLEPEVFEDDQFDQDHMSVLLTQRLVSRS
jgi:hypothetical protein